MPRRRARWRSRAAPWLAVALLYAATLGLPADGDRLGGDERTLLAGAQALAEGRGLDSGRDLLGAGPPALLAPAQLLGGRLGTELMGVALAALAFALAAALGRRLGPEPWATAAALLVALSPPALGAATAVLPDAAAAAVLAGGALLALDARERPTIPRVCAAALLLALAPWLAPELLGPALVATAALALWTARGRPRQVLALACAEIMLASVVAQVTLNDRLYGAFTAPRGQDTPEPGGPERLAALLADRDAGLLRWAPVLGLAGLAGWLLWRSRRDRLARALPAQRDVEAAAGLLAAMVAAHALAVALTPVVLGAAAVPARSWVAVLPLLAALCAWGLRHAPRTGAALGALGLAGSVWLGAELATGSVDGWSRFADSSAPWGPLEALLPRYGAPSAWSAIVTVAALAALAALVMREWWRRREAALSSR